MSRQHVSHKEIAQFAIDKVNLPKDQADKYRKQAKRLRDKFDVYIKDHPDFTLKKMILSGSLAKGTGLRSLNDIDVACYISGADAPKKTGELIEYMAERLRDAFPNFSDDQVQPKTYCVTVSFKGSGLDVDFVPILYDGNPNWYGNLVSQDDGTLLETCIPRHLEFIKKRKQAQDKHFAQVVRLAKFWVKKMKAERTDFRFKSFMVELVLAKLADDGANFSDYPEALQHFFTYLASKEMREKVFFTDYYKASDLPACDDFVQIIDPVNAENNAAMRYTKRNADAIADAALDAGDAIDGALYAPTKQLTVTYWQKIFGPQFQG